MHKFHLSILYRKSFRFLIHSNHRPQLWPVNDPKSPLTQVLPIVTATSMRLGTVAISFCRQKTKPQMVKPYAHSGISSQCWGVHLNHLLPEPPEANAHYNADQETFSMELFNHGLWYLFYLYGFFFVNNKVYKLISYFSWKYLLNHLHLLENSPSMKWHILNSLV